MCTFTVVRELVHSLHKSSLQIKCTLGTLCIVRTGHSAHWTQCTVESPIQLYKCHSIGFLLECFCKKKNLKGIWEDGSRLGGSSPQTPTSFSFPMEKSMIWEAIWYQVVGSSLNMGTQSQSQPGGRKLPEYTLRSQSTRGFPGALR